MFNVAYKLWMILYTLDFALDQLIESFNYSQM
jgi:hypothetical protein